MAVNFGLLDTSIPERLGAMPANALAMRRQRIMQDEQIAGQREQQQMQNALARMQMTKAQADMDEETAYKNALAGVQGNDYAGSMPKLMQASPTRAMALQKQLTEQQKSLIEGRAKMTDLQGKRLEMYRSLLTEVQTPEQMANWYIQQRSDPDLQGFQWPTTIDDTLAQLRRASANPRDFEQWKMKTALGMKAFMEAQPKPTAFMQELQARGIEPGSPQWNAALEAKANKETTHAPGTTVSFGAPVAAVDANGNPVFIQPSKSGGAPAVIPGVRPPDSPSKAPTEAEAKAAFYAGNMRAASAVLDRLEAEGVDMSKLSTQADTALAGGVTNVLASEKAQQVMQARRQWSEQMLRMQTGAAATADETNRTVATYFPQPGDSKQVVAQKRAMRQQAEQGVFAASGRAQGRVEQQTGAAKAPASPTAPSSSGGVKFLGFE